MSPGERCRTPPAQRLAFEAVFHVYPQVLTFGGRKTQTAASIDRNHDLPTQVDQALNRRWSQRHPTHRLLTNQLLDPKNFNPEEQVGNPERRVLA